MEFILELEFYTIILLQIELEAVFFYVHVLELLEMEAGFLLEAYYVVENNAHWPNPYDYVFLHVFCDNHPGVLAFVALCLAVYLQNTISGQLNELVLGLGLHLFWLELLV